MKRPFKIAVIDYQMSNMFSIQNALNLLGYDCDVTSDRAKILSADGAILPGVGSFPEAMKHMKDLGKDESIKDFIATGKPFMGICLGFQLLFEESDEIVNTSGLGVLPGRVSVFPKGLNGMRVPHVGWNSIRKYESLHTDILIDPLKKIGNGEYLYFIHSCYVTLKDNRNLYTTTEYKGFEFCSSVLMDNIFACQFHPEKSGETGITIIREMFS